MINELTPRYPPLWPASKLSLFLLCCCFVAYTDGINTLKQLALKARRPHLPSDDVINKIIEPGARSMLEDMKFSEIQVPSYIAQDNKVAGSYCVYPNTGTSTQAPIVLIHGFDSSFLEFRRLAPLLATNRDVFVPDILGWGFIDHSNVEDFSPKAKLDYLKAFLEQVVKKPCIIVGASLGGAIAINLSVDEPQLVEKVILLNAQGFIDGKGPSNIPDFLAAAGINILKSTFVRNYANQIAYVDQKTFSTADAMNIGRVHCFTESWERASISFLKSGGFVVSQKVPQLNKDTLVLWGRQDRILEPSTANKFEEMLPKCTLRWLETAGHVPHLEVPLETAGHIKSFLGEEA